MFTGLGDDDNPFFDFLAPDSFAYLGFADWISRDDESQNFSRTSDQFQSPSIPDTDTYTYTGTDTDNIIRPEYTESDSMSSSSQSHQYSLHSPEQSLLYSPVSMPIPTHTVTITAATSRSGTFSDHTITQMRRVGQKSKEKPKSFPHEARHEMKHWILTNYANPFPSFEIKNTWANNFRLSMQQVNTFLANNRARLLGRLKDRIPQSQQSVLGFINGLPVTITFGNMPTNSPH
jgi:hypothetical protein